MSNMFLYRILIEGESKPEVIRHFSRCTKCFNRLKQ